MYKFRNVSDPHSGTSNTTHGVLTDLQIKWNSYLSIASMIPNVTFLLLNAAIGHKVSEGSRRLKKALISSMI
jgi:hypothetical protein